MTAHFLSPLKIDVKEIADRYNHRLTLWPDGDKWHDYARNTIARFIQKNVQLEPDSALLNAGSGGNDYGLVHENTVHLDIADELIKRKVNYVIGSIEDIPIESDRFSRILCVGSVLNYCDPVPGIRELARVLKPGGRMIIEFEKSDTPELLFQRDFNKEAVLMSTFYGGDEEVIWYFSEKHIRRLLKEQGFTIESSFRFHILSSLILKLTRKSNFASRFSVFDSILRKIPLLGRLSSNVILVVQMANKKGSIEGH